MIKGLFGISLCGTAKYTSLCIQPYKFRSCALLKVMDSLKRMNLDFDFVLFLV